MESIDCCENLNEQQKKAVLTTEGAVLVLAGAGTGKTSVLVHRIAHILQTGKAKPYQIMALTFTNRAAREMQERLNKIFGFSIAQDMWVCTFHRAAARILRRSGHLIGVAPDFLILDQNSQEQLLKTISADSQNPALKTDYPGLILSIIQKWKDLDMSCEDIVHYMPLTENEVIAQALYPIYEERLRNSNSLDFGDLLLKSVKIFQEFPEERNVYCTQFRYFLVDEYQDTNFIQYLFLRHLASKIGNICCVGDEDQLIYSWRGARLENILRFDQDFPQAQIIRLEENYRSSVAILATASRLVACNTERLGKNLWTQDQTDHPVLITRCWDSDSEVKLVISQIEKLYSEGIAWSFMAILFRAGFQTRIFEEALMMKQIPYRLIGGQRFYDREEIRDVVAYMRILNSDFDDLSFLRIVNKPVRGIGNVTVKAIKAYAEEHKISLLKATREFLLFEKCTKSAHKALTSFLGVLDVYRDRLDTMELHVLVKSLLIDIGYFQFLDFEGNEGRRENVMEFLNSLVGRGSIFSFLETLMLDSEIEAQSGGNFVTLSTLHAAKGLEFNTVFLPGWEEGVFPHHLSCEEKKIEEERRLAYVGLTRAEKNLFISYAEYRMIYGKWTASLPSRFLYELYNEHVELAGQGSLEPLSIHQAS